MTRLTRLGLVSLLSVAVWSCGAAVGEEKLRVLVDKVMQPQAKWRTEEWMVREAAEAGFNVFSPRKGYDDPEAVKQVTAWCAAYGIRHMPWMRGSLDVPLSEAAAAGKRVVWTSGLEQPLWSVNSDEFWDWTTRHILSYAQLSVEQPALMGVFLDYENYAPGAAGNLYDLSYDDGILTRFAVEAGVAIPALAPDQRKAWLTDQVLHDRFAAFQVQHWRERCRALRQAVDGVNPAFQFCIYPAPGTPFMIEATYPEWATAAAPLILADASTYGRPSKFMSEQEALDANRRLLTERMQAAVQAGIPFVYTGGIDPVVHGADPEFSGKNAVMCAEVTGGYWIFYEGPTHTKQDHRDYWKWFTWANGKIAAGDFAAQHQPREAPEHFFEDVFKHLDGTSLPSFAAADGAKRDYPQARLRGENLLLVAGKAGEPAEITLQHVPVAAYEAPLKWELRGPDLAVAVSGVITQAETGVVRFTPERDGVYVLAASAGPCAYSVVSATAPLTVYAGVGASFIGPVSRLYLAAPGGVDAFLITARSSGQETVRVNVYNAENAQIATGQTAPNAGTVEISVPVSGAGGVWSIETARADAGVVEDYTLTLDAKTVPCLSLLPEHVFAAGVSR